MDHSTQSGVAKLPFHEPFLDEKEMAFFYHFWVILEFLTFLLLEMCLLTIIMDSLGVLYHQNTNRPSHLFR